LQNFANLTYAETMSSVDFCIYKRPVVCYGVDDWNTLDESKWNSYSVWCVAPVN